MAKTNVSRKELLKEPDEFITTSARVVQFVREHTRQVILGVSIFLICVAAGVAYFSYMQYRQNEADFHFDKAFRQYRLAVASEDALSKEELEGLLSQFQAVADEYGSFMSGERALLYTAHILYKQGKHEEALKRYELLLDSSLAERGLREMIEYHIAMTRLSLKDYDGAVSLFKEMAKDTSSPYCREASAAVADIYEAMGKRKEAVLAYKQYLKMFPQAPDAAYIRARIADLSSQG